MREVLAEQQRPLLAARWAQVEALARERPEVIVTTTRIRAPDTRDAQSEISAREEPFADVADALQTEHAICARVLLVVEVAELAEVTLEDRVELIPAPGDVAVA